MKDEESDLKKTQVSVNIAALVAASTNTTQSIDPDKMKARILEKQEAVHDRKEKRKVQARLSEIQEALKETKAVQEMKEQESLTTAQGPIPKTMDNPQPGEEKEEQVDKMKSDEALEEVNDHHMEDQEESKFRPKACVMPPSPSKEETPDVNPLDVKPGVKVIEGKVTDWRGKFGFMSSDQMEGKIFLHSKDFVEGRHLVKVGATAFFQVLHQESSVVGAKAVNVRIME